MKELEIAGKTIKVTINTLHSTRWTVSAILELSGVGIGIEDNILCMHHEKKLVLIPIYNIAKIKVIK